MIHWSTRGDEKSPLDEAIIGTRDAPALSAQEMLFGDRSEEGKVIEDLSNN
jgi:hypothetical protein